ncbi:CGBP1 protein, partial [Polyodon spathula]|nr:CGBP1 protein [Polyodon spathula]
MSKKPKNVSAADHVKQHPAGVYTATEETRQLQQVFADRCANIPFEKLNNQKLQKFFRQSVANGGSIPSSTQLRHEYLPKVAEYHKQEIMELVKESGCLSVLTLRSRLMLKISMGYTLDLFCKT